MKEKILNLIKENGHVSDQDTNFIIEQLTHCLIDNKKKDVSNILEWLEKKRKEYPVRTEEIGIKELDKWGVDEKTGNITHETGRFFQIIGVRSSGAVGREVSSWTQPMIKQAECGILGIICKKIDGVMHYLLYAKYEPGNMHKLQLSPTLQATASNLNLAHGGKKPLFAEYFEEGGNGKIITNVEGVEDGGRFYMKTNRNMLVEIPETELQEVPEDFIWVTLPQFKKLLQIDGVVNSLARSVMGSR